MENGHRTLVVGATGLLGTEITRQLSQNQDKIRALVRSSADPTKREKFTALGTETVEGDLKDRSSLQHACTNVKTVVSTATSTLSRQAGDSFESVDRDGHFALIEAAEAAGARHFVFVSVPEIDSDYTLLRIKRQVEERMKESPMSWTILRPLNFMEAWLSPLLGFDPVHGQARVLGSGDKPVSWISLHDVARFAVAATQDRRLVNSTLDLGGPEALSYHQVLAIYEDLGCPPAHIEYVPEEALEAQLKEAKTPLEEAFAAIMLGTARGLTVSPDAALEILPGKLSTVREHATQMIKDAR